ncbi:alpha/beta fold hydrolase [Segeticoccus rhizosphaerae]|jgi:pimeloyl-ACP methyl ester carboxylesterase|uniref:alpha/beta fold hydrolase n=1 Tax=Segeticoccus rhizosphaerae TaxID=1104777 RepID=UPI00126412B4|nr:alpha/beta hydrolase [Segeticoccus rhizosphaerae]
MSDVELRDRYRVEVPGGGLDVHDLTSPAVLLEGAATPNVVLALHGITANGLTWQPVASALGRTSAGPTRFLAPDLRGRAGSRDVTGPWGLPAHVDDVLAMADAFGAQTFTLVGHSMGAFVAALAAARHPDRVRSVVLVDGGFAFPVPPDLDVDAALQAVIGPAMERLSMQFADAGAYLDFWREHPALGPLFDGPAGGALQAYLMHDLVSQGGALASTCVLDAVRADGADVLFDAEVHAGARTAAGAGIPVEFLWAQRGLVDEPQGLYDEQRLAALRLPEDVRVTAIPGTNHYSVVLGRLGAGQVAAAIARVSGVGKQPAQT